MTISKLAKELGVSRDYIYNHLMKKYEVDDRKELPNAFDDEDLAYLQDELKKRDQIVDDNIKKTKVKKKRKIKKLTEAEKSTSLERLLHAKREYNWVLQNIEDLRNEINEYKNENQTSCISAGNGSITILPQQKQMESYEKLLLSMNKLIEELENKLDLEKTNEEKGMIDLYA